MSIIERFFEGLKFQSGYMIFATLYWLFITGVSLGSLFFGAVFTVFGSALGPMLLLLGCGAFLFGFFSFFFFSRFRP